MDTIDPKVANAWINRDIAEALKEMAFEIESERAQVKMWVRHYDELDQRFEKLCDALYKIVGFEEHEYETAPWVARIALQEVGKWPN